jgi:hypothetical protein
MNKGINSILMIVGVATIIVSGLLGPVFPVMYVGIIVGVVTAWGAMPSIGADKQPKRDENDLNLSFDGTTTQTGMSM